MRAGFGGTRKEIGGVLIACVLVAGAVGCSPAPMPVVEAPPAVEPLGDSGFGPEIGLIEENLFLDLRDKGYFGPWEQQYLRVPPSLSWEQLTTYYATQLGPQWKTDPSFNEYAIGDRRRVWRLDAPQQQTGAFAIAYVSHADFVRLGYQNAPADFAVLIVEETKP